MSSPEERGQRSAGVHHPEVSEPLFRRADEGEKLGGSVSERGAVGGLFCICPVIGYYPKVGRGLRSRLASTLRK